MDKPFPALPGFYRLLFLYLEPVSTAIPTIMIWIFPGAGWFLHQLIPSLEPPPSTQMEPRTKMAVYQLSSCYLLLAMLSSLSFRAIRDELPTNPRAQERIIGSILLALAICDLVHASATFLGLPDDLKYAPSMWNSMTHGNITVVLAGFCARLAWFMGVGRRRYYFGVGHASKVKK